MIHIYKPNSKNTGCAASFSCGPTGKNNDLTAFISVIQQVSWDDKTKTGSFSSNKGNPEKTANIKLGPFEVGDIINSIRTYREFSAFHSFGEDKTQIKLTNWKKSENDKWFGLSITRNGINYKLPLTSGEAEVIMTFLEGMLQKNNEKAYAYKKD